MKPVPWFRALISVIIGITLGLQLTLAWWGNTWWQIVVSCIAGSVFGLAIADYRRAFTAFRNIGQWTWTELKKLDLAAVFQKRASLKLVGAVFGTIYGVLLALFIAGCLWPTIFRAWSTGDLSDQIFMVVFGFLALILVGVLGAKWGASMVDEDIACDDVLESVIKSPRARKEINAVLGVPLFILVIIAFLVWIGLKWLAVFIAAAIASIPGIAFLVLRLPFVVIYHINQQKLMKIAASIVFGILIGTAHHSRVWGWASGLAFYALAGALERLAVWTAPAYRAFWSWYRHQWNLASNWAKP